MKQRNKYRALVLTILTVIMTECKSSDEILGITIVPMLTSEITTGDKHSLYGFTDKEWQAVQFAQQNWANLTADMAKGQGENLTTIAALLNIRDTKRAAFYAMTKNKFTHLIPTPGTTAEQLVLELKTESAKL
jgi:hypothetical protein